MAPEKTEQIIKQYTTRGADYTWDIYQPIPLPGFEVTYQHAGRKCVDRLSAILDTIRKKFGDRKLTIIDIGSNMGFFVFELALRGHTVIGVDNNAKYIETCNWLANGYTFDTKPTFIHKEIDAFNLDDELPDADIALCFSVIHHFKDKLSILKSFSKKFPYALIEMDGRELGRFDLGTFYYNPINIGSTNDPYGKGTKHRVTWECDNTENPNLKQYNIVMGRGVFRAGDYVIKQSRKGVQHSWLKTGLPHEASIYQKYNGSEFLANFIDYTEDDKYENLKIQYIHNIGLPTINEVHRLYEFLQINDLFIIDFIRDMFLFDENNHIKLIDLESVVPNNTITSFMRNPDKVRPYDTYKKQISFLEKLYTQK
jgi:hypothetical protein